MWRGPLLSPGVVKSGGNADSEAWKEGFQSVVGVGICKARWRGCGGCTYIITVRIGKRKG